MVNIGDTAPAFTLKTTDKSDVSLADFHGQIVILAFYPGAFTGVCDKEMCAFQDNLGSLNDANAVVLGISVDSPWANAEFAKKYNLEFALLSDVDRKVVNAYDATFVGLGGIEGYVSANRVIIIEKLVKMLTYDSSDGNEDAEQVMVMQEPVSYTHLTLPTTVIV